MQTSYRKILADGDLILQKKGCILFGGSWKNWRNLSEESRLLKEHMDSAFMKYKQLQHLYVVASTNVKHDSETLQLHGMDNSCVELRSLAEQSLLEEREGVKYRFGGNNNQNGNNGNSQKQKGQNNGNDGSGNQNQNKQQNQNNQNKGNQSKGSSLTLMELLMNARLSVPNTRH